MAWGPTGRGGDWSHGGRPLPSSDHAALSSNALDAARAQRLSAPPNPLHPLRDPFLSALRQERNADQAECESYYLTAEQEGGRAIGEAGPRENT